MHTWLTLTAIYVLHKYLNYAMQWTHTHRANQQNQVRPNDGKVNVNRAKERERTATVSDTFHQCSLKLNYHATDSRMRQYGATSKCVFLSLVRLNVPKLKHSSLSIFAIWHSMRFQWQFTKELFSFIEKHISWAYRKTNALQ